MRSVALDPTFQTCAILIRFAIDAAGVWLSPSPYGMWPAWKLPVDESEEPVIAAQEATILHLEFCQRRVTHGARSPWDFPVAVSCQNCLIIFFQKDVTVGIRSLWKIYVDVHDEQIIAVQKESTSHLEIQSARDVTDGFRKVMESFGRYDLKEFSGSGQCCAESQELKSHFSFGCQWCYVQGGVAVTLEISCSYVKPCCFLTS